MLDDNGIRPPVIAAGINLFGGPLGLLHRHVTGAIPIRRNTKDPAYLVTLKAYVAELLQRHDLLFYIEGGRSYSGELKAPKTGLLHAAMQADATTRSIVPMAVAYDLVLEDHILAHQAREAAAAAVRARNRRDGALRRRLPVARVRHLRRADPPRAAATAESRRDVMALAHLMRDTIGRLYKVLPTAVLAAAMRPSITRRELEARAEAIIETVRAAGGNLGVTSGREAVEEGAEPLADAQHHPRRARRPLPRARAHRAALLRAHPPAPVTGSQAGAPNALMIGSRLQGLLPRARRQPALKHLASRYGMRSPTASRAGSSPAKPSRKRSPPRARSKPPGMTADARLPRRERRDDGGGRRRDARLPGGRSTRSSRPASAATSR